MIFQLIKGFLFVLFKLFILHLALELVKPETIEYGGCRIFLMGKIHRPHFFIVQILDREVSQESSVGKSVTCEINLFSSVAIVDVIFSPLFFPCLRHKSDWKSSSQLDRLTHR